MAEPQDLRAMRRVLDNISQSIAGAGNEKGVGLTPGAIVATIKTIQFIMLHIESLEERIKALESKP